MICILVSLLWQQWWQSMVVWGAIDEAHKFWSACLLPSLKGKGQGWAHIEDICMLVCFVPCFMVMLSISWDVKFILITCHRSCETLTFSSILLSFNRNFTIAKIVIFLFDKKTQPNIIASTKHGICELGNIFDHANRRINGALGQCSFIELMDIIIFVDYYFHGLF